MKTLYALIFLCLSANSFAGSLDLCNRAASKLNASLPQRIDKITVITNVSCVQAGGATIAIYNTSIDLPRMLTKKEINTLGAIQMERWCTTPELRTILYEYDVEYMFYVENRYAGKTHLTSEMCN